MKCNIAAHTGRKFKPIPEGKSTPERQCNDQNTPSASRPSRPASRHTKARSPTAQTTTAAATTCFGPTLGAVPEVLVAEGKNQAVSVGSIMSMPLPSVADAVAAAIAGVVSVRTPHCTSLPV